MHEEPNTTASDQQLLKCSNCGANMKFAPGKLAMKCDACGTENTIQTKDENIVELDFHEYIKKAVPKEDHQEITLITCDSCGASTRFDPNVVSAECGFCTSPLTVKNASKCDVLRPKSLLPFGIDQNKGFDEFKKWINGRWFAPNDLKRYATRPEKLSGMYLPYWTYDADTKSFYTGQRGIRRTETYTTYENGKTVTKTRTVTDWYFASGTVNENFDDVLVVASKSLPKKYVDALEPWDLKNLVPFDEQFLSGFKAESYQLDLEGGFSESKKIMDVKIRVKVKKDIGGDDQRITTLSTQHNNVTFKHILLPVWLSAFKYNDKVYRFMINGRTGEVQGERPYSFWKIFFFVLLCLGVVAGIVIAIIIAQK
jgi:transcription elongation factor Elf1